MPALAEYAISELLAGLRPAAPYMLPIICSGEHSSLTIATGTYRNGMLLAPAAAKLAASHASGNALGLTPVLLRLVDSFSLSRFSQVGGGTSTLTANSSPTGKQPQLGYATVQTKFESPSLNNGTIVQNGVAGHTSEINLQIQVRKMILLL